VQGLGVLSESRAGLVREQPVALLAQGAERDLTRRPERLVARHTPSGHGADPGGRQIVRMFHVKSTRRNRRHSNGPERRRTRRRIWGIVLQSGDVRKLARRLTIGIGAICALWLVVCGFFYVAMLQPPERFGRIIAGIPGPLRIVMAALPFETMWNSARGGDLAPGDLAPDFCLAEAQSSEDSQPSGECVRLSSFRGSRPVVLVFGSYT